MPQTPPEPTPHQRFLALLLAWAWPGLGHITLGERKRGLLIMAGVLFLFFSGLLIGGLDVVDSRRDRLWFIAQALCGPVTLVTDWASQNLLERMPVDWRRDYEWLDAYEEEEPDPDVIQQLRVTSLGRVNEIGTLYIALAGLMNLVVILDTLRPPADQREERAA